jgi:hypothetical protein
MDKRKAVEFSVEQKEQALAGHRFMSWKLLPHARHMVHQKMIHATTRVRHPSIAALMGLVVRYLIQQNNISRFNTLSFSFENQGVTQFELPNFRGICEPTLKVESPAGGRNSFWDEVLKIPDSCSRFNRRYEFEGLKLSATRSISLDEG